MTYDIKRVLTCHKCYAEKVFTSNDYRDINSIDSIPCSCGEGTMMIDKTQTIIGNIVKVLLQETIEEAGINPRKIEAELTSKNVYVIEAGKDFRFEADVWSVSFRKKNVNLNRIVLDVIRLRCLDEDTTVMPTDSEIQQFESMDRIKVIESLAPQVIYRTNEKTALLISMLSGGRVDNIRGDLSVFLAGDPSTGKSDMLEALHSLDKRSYLVSGRSTSAAGLVAGVDNLADGTRIASFGPVILAHEHFVCIDEGDKMKPDDRSMLHDVMESQTAHLNKVGINVTMNAQTKIIMAANPKASSYDKQGSIKANLGMPDSFLARFGYIFLCLDDFDRDMERTKIRRINEIKIKGLSSVIEKEGLLNKESLIKYMNYAKYFKPEFEPNALSKLEDLYIDLKFMEQKAGSLAIDTRSYHDIIRASYSFAKFRFSDMVEIEDVNRAWELQLSALESFGMKTKGDLQQSIFAQRDNTKDQWIHECVNACSQGKLLNLTQFKLKLQENSKMFRNIDMVNALVSGYITTGWFMITPDRDILKITGQYE